MKQYQLKTYYKKILADTITPVSIYLKIRDKFPNSILLESSDYHTTDNSFSYICCNPIANFKVSNEQIEASYPDGTLTTQSTVDIDVVESIRAFSQSFLADETDTFKFIHNGIFGYIAYDGVRYFEDIDISKKSNSLDIPDVLYSVYKNRFYLFSTISKCAICVRQFNKSCFSRT